MATDYKTYTMGDVKLQSGATLHGAYLAYKTFGDPKSPAIIYPTWYSGKIADNVWLIGDDKTVSPNKYFIIIPALVGNGESISPSNAPSMRPWPNVTFYDNVKMQHELVTKHLGISHAHAVIGWSMGAAQTFQWGTTFPEFMDYLVPFCGSARTSEHNQVFLEGVKSALLSGRQASSSGVCELESIPERPWTSAERTVALKALSRVYAGWGFSQTFYRQQLYKTAPELGFKNLEDFMVNFWEAWGLSKEPENMLAMLWTWQSGDVSKQDAFNGDFEKAMKAIKAKCMVMPCRTDLYFPPEDSEIEVSLMQPGIGKLTVFESVWGHWAGGPGQSLDDVDFLNDKLKDFFNSAEMEKSMPPPENVLPLR